MKDTRLEGTEDEGKGVSVSRTPREELAREGKEHPKAELQGALKVVRSIAEHVTTPFSEAYTLLELLERELTADRLAGRPPSEAAFRCLHRLRGVMLPIAGSLRKYALIETLRIRQTLIGEVIDLDASALPLEDPGEEGEAPSSA